jgi:integrase
MLSQSIPTVSLYIRKRGSRRYEQVTRRNPQVGDGVYSLRFEEDGKRKWLTVGTDINAALKARFQKESELAQGFADPKPSPAPSKSLEECREEFLHDKRTTFKGDGSPLDPDTIRSYEIVTRGFLDVIKRNQPSHITRQDLKNWIAKQRERVSHNTVCNRYVSIVCFLHFCGIDHKKLLPQSERPAKVEETREAYTQEEMTNLFFAITNERDALAFELFLKTGPRERELSHLEWTHLNLGPTPTVSYLTRANFRTKTGKSRTIPLERGLANRLADWRAKNATSRLGFSTGDGKVEGHFLRLCKFYAKASGQDTARFWLHKFRDSFATWSLRRGVDIRTVQHWLGHTNIEMTMRYLAPEQGEQAQGLINKAFGEAVAVSPTP